jgi:hypothetical protein
MIKTNKNWWDGLGWGADQDIEVDNYLEETSWWKYIELCAFLCHLRIWTWKLLLLLLNDATMYTLDILKKWHKCFCLLFNHVICMVGVSYGNRFHYLYVLVYGMHINIDTFVLVVLQQHVSFSKHDAAISSTFKMLLMCIISTT